MQTSPETKTILVVDDNFSVVTVVQSMLEAADYKVIAASTADVAISVAKRNDVIDLLLIDVVMPDVNGPDLADRILTIHPHAKVLFMSGYPGSELLEQNVHTAGFLPKPFSSRTLQNAIDRVFAPAIETSAATR